LNHIRACLKIPPDSIFPGNALGATFMENEDDGHSFGKKFLKSCVLIGNYMLAFKNPIFREE